MTMTPVIPSAVSEYREALARLAAARTRGQQAAVLDELAGQAGNVASAYVGSGGGIEDTEGDPFSWHETATLFTQMAAALRGTLLAVADPEDSDSWQEPYWRALAAAASPEEFAAAFYSFEQATIKSLDRADLTAPVQPAPVASARPATTRQRIAWRRLRAAANDIIAAWQASRS
jgi:hypothetical protein